MPFDLLDAAHRVVARAIMRARPFAREKAGWRVKLPFLGAGDKRQNNARRERSQQTNMQSIDRSNNTTKRETAQQRICSHSSVSLSTNKERRRRRLLSLDQRINH